MSIHPNSSIHSITINSLKPSRSFDGEFVLSDSSNLNLLFNKEKSFKSKFFTLLIVNGGTGNLLIDSTLHNMKIDRVFYINYNQIFRFSELHNFSAQIVLFTRSFYNMIYTGNMKIKNDTAFSGLPSFVDFNKTEFSEFLLSVSDMQKEFSKNTVLSKEIVCLLLKAAMLKYIRKAGGENYIDFKTNKKISYVEDFKDLVNVNFKELKRTSDYAAKLSITANYLNAVVKEKLDISAENYIQNRVILEAERLLLNTDMSVTEISYELGFSDKSHFGKYFKKTTSETPNNFRKKFVAAQ
ncbi:AraC family transcriptional regulator [Chryseobacterium sp.]|uniref:AraC family transcriptional regulator n=1 Tax=Chryseobacterium sp. TaxID=1871047 RepID=UPI0011CA0B11|nr:helix-turn-helix domain-containing protein [Chryseobacterium sp.]TXF79565.1 helix-turn-helix domain-containing protein [Chryseobacterium sp.]